MWSIRTTATKPTGETPFFLVYGAEAVLPHEVRCRSARVLVFDEAQQDAMRRAGGGTSPRSRAASDEVPTSAATISLPQHPPQNSRGRRPRAQAGSLQGGTAQALSHVGGPVQGCSCFQARLRALGDSGGSAGPECMEHPAPPEVLPLKRPRAYEARRVPVKLSRFGKGPEPVKQGECL